MFGFDIHRRPYFLDQVIKASEMVPRSLAAAVFGQRDRLDLSLENAASDIAAAAEFSHGDRSSCYKWVGTWLGCIVVVMEVRQRSQTYRRRMTLRLRCHRPLAFQYRARMDQHRTYWPGLGSSKD